MSAAEDLLTRLIASGIELKADGAKLRFRPKAAMTAELAEQVKAHKPGLLAILAGTAEAVTGGISEAHPDNKPRPNGPSCPAHAETGQARSESGPQPVPSMSGRQPDLYEVDGQMMTFVGRAEYYRDRWRVDGYPPGVRPNDEQSAVEPDDGS